MPIATSFAPVLRALLLVVLCLVAGCANRVAVTHSSRGYGGSSSTRYYPPPGPPEDPWGPYVSEASRRFRVPEQWVRRVMRQESGGQAGVVSTAGAMGLMQVMPATYEGLRRRYGLGDDPFDPHNNMLAGTAYLREMYDRYGSPGFLAAYNAGPRRVDDYLAGSGALPDETIGYLAAIAPNLGDEIPVSGPLAVFAQRGGGIAAARQFATAVAVARADGCDPDAAYDPDRACTPAPAVVVADAPAPLTAPVPQTGYCDPDAAYDPGRPCRPMPFAAPAAVTVAPLPPAMLPAPPERPRYQLASAIVPAPTVARTGTPTAGSWAIQVGAFADPTLARSVADRARGAAADLLGAARVELPTTSPFGGSVLYRARLVTLSGAQAAQSCARLNALQIACMVIPPSTGS